MTVARRLRLAVLVVALIAGALALGRWLVDRWAHVHVTDSRIAARIVTIGAEVAGRVTAIPVVAGDQVAAGDLLVRIETRQAELRLQELDAERVRIDAEQAQLRARQAMIDGQVASRLEAGRTQIKAAEAELRAVGAALDAARSDYHRQSTLRREGAASMQQFEEVRARFFTTQQQTLRATAGVDAAHAALKVIEAESAEIAVLNRQIAVLEAQKTALAARLAQQRVDLDNREIRAAFGGVVDATFVDVGEQVAPGSRLLMVHDPTAVWVDANIKETEFRRVRLGAPAAIAVDAYPGRIFGGKVVRLGHAATSEFALLPAPNPSGNFTKVTQRLPVRIAVEQDGLLLRPGMMVTVSIDVVD